PHVRRFLGPYAQQARRTPGHTDGREVLQVLCAVADVPADAAVLPRQADRSDPRLRSPRFAAHAVPGRHPPRAAQRQEDPEGMGEQAAHEHRSGDYGRAVHHPRRPTALLGSRAAVGRRGLSPARPESATGSAPLVGIAPASAGSDSGIDAKLGGAMAEETPTPPTPSSNSQRPPRRRKKRHSQQRRKTAAAHHQQRRARLKAARAAHPVAVTYPDDLPVTAAKDEIAEAIRDNQVVIIAGETGSGKTTQLPKICLELGLGVDGLIGHTQPRRIAARTVAERIADELEEDLGDTIGYQVRFTAQVA